MPKSVGLLEQAEKAYKHEAIIGSDEKTVRGEENFKIIGAEVLSCKRLRDAGIVSVAAPLSKRIPMSMLSLAIAELPCVSRSLASRAAGNWIEEGREVVGLDRRTAEELVLAAVFGLFAATDVSVPYCSEVFATDSSNAKGAFTEKTVDQPLAETIWLGGDKKGTYTMLDPLRGQSSEALEKTQTMKQCRWILVTLRRFWTLLLTLLRFAVGPAHSPRRLQHEVLEYVPQLIWPQVPTMTWRAQNFSIGFSR